MLDMGGSQELCDSLISISREVTTPVWFKKAARTDHRANVRISAARPLILDGKSDDAARIDRLPLHHKDIIEIEKVESAGSFQLSDVGVRSSGRAAPPFLMAFREK
jgi:hypothetical protein